MRRAIKARTQEVDVWQGESVEDGKDDERPEALRSALLLTRTYDSVEQERGDLSDNTVANAPAEYGDGTALGAYEQREDLGRIAVCQPP